jgi:hypothetical protein
MDFALICFAAKEGGQREIEFESTMSHTMPFHKRNLLSFLLPFSQTQKNK